MIVLLMFVFDVGVLRCWALHGFTFNAYGFGYLVVFWWLLYLLILCDCCFALLFGCLLVNFWVFCLLIIALG